MNIIDTSNTGIYDIYVPSLSAVLPFKEINTSQQKKIAKSIISGDDVYCTEFYYCALQIIKENAVDPITLDNLTIHDLLVILIAMRANSLGSTLALNITCTQCGAKHTMNINLYDLYKKLVSKKPAQFNVKVGADDYAIMLPTLNYEKEIIYKIKSKLVVQENIIKDFFVLNTLRYLDCDKFNDYSKGYDFITNLFLSEFEQIKNTIDTVNNQFNDCVLFDFNCIHPCTINHRKTISYDVGYFYTFLKLLFSEDLLSIHKDIYYLQKIGIDPEYAQTLTSMERQLLWNYFLEDEKSKKEKNSSSGVF